MITTVICPPEIFTNAKYANFKKCKILEVIYFDSYFVHIIYNMYFTQYLLTMTSYRIKGYIKWPWSKFQYWLPGIISSNR